MTAWRLHVVCADPELSGPFSYHEQLITVTGFPDLAAAIGDHNGHDVQAILVDRLGINGEVRVRPPAAMHPVVWWREIASAVELSGQAGGGEAGAGIPGAG